MRNIKRTLPRITQEPTVKVSGAASHNRATLSLTLSIKPILAPAQSQQHILTDHLSGLPTITNHRASWHTHNNRIT